MNATLDAPPRLRSLRLQPAAPSAADSPEQIADHVRRACRTGRLDLAVAAATAALPRAEPNSPASTQLRDLSRASRAELAPPGEDRLWLLRRFDGSMIAMLRLRDDGTVAGRVHANESRWSMRDGVLQFVGPDGRATTRFTLHGESGGRRLHAGLFMDDQTVHVLTEIDCAYARLCLLDPELVGPFAGHFRPEQMAVPPLPEKPAVILAAPRTGSHLLLNLLNSSQRVFFDAELMNPSTISIFGSDIPYDGAGLLYILRRNDPLAFARVMMARSHHTDGRMLDGVAVRGFKLFPQQSVKVYDWVVGDPDFRLVHLHRANLLAEYSSLLVAYAEGHWVGGPESLKQHRILFQPERFRRFVQMKTIYLDGLRERLARRHGPSIEIEYSAISPASVHGVLSMLLDDPAVDAPLSALGLRQQLNESVIDRFANPDDVRRCLDGMGREAWAGVERAEVR